MDAGNFNIVCEIWYAWCWLSGEVLCGFSVPFTFGQEFIWPLLCLTCGICVYSSGFVL